MSNISIIPLFFLFVIVIILVLVFLVRFISKRMSIRSNFFIIGIYIGVIIVLTLICTFLPSGVLIKNGPTIQSDNEWNALKEVYQNISNGNYKAPNGLVKNGDYSFTATGIIMLDTDNIRQYTSTATSANGIETVTASPNVWFGTKGVDAPDNGDGKIDVYCYMIPGKISGLDYKLPTWKPKVTFQNQLLCVVTTMKYSGNLYQFNDNLMPVNLMGNILSTQVFPSGDEIVVAMLPKGVTIPNENYNDFKAMNDIS